MSTTATCDCDDQVMWLWHFIAPCQDVPRPAFNSPALDLQRQQVTSADMEAVGKSLAALFSGHIDGDACALGDGNDSARRSPKHLIVLHLWFQVTVAGDGWRWQAPNIKCAFNHPVHQPLALAPSVVEQTSLTFAIASHQFLHSSPCQKHVSL